MCLACLDSYTLDEGILCPLAATEDPGQAHFYCTECMNASVRARCAADNAPGEGGLVHDRKGNLICPVYSCATDRAYLDKALVQVLTEETYGIYSSARSAYLTRVALEEAAEEQRKQKEREAEVWFCTGL